ncbi:hypothetical protein DEAC_c42050 [Desulfosporosinus acididurans]|uniref:Uncharacterized protein n=1 Tax=Desulfosporosinus acididurans TaxID=476652 RepID=A0A0J1FLS5_9FIRM|nr:hypothetical protein DEAC_c42050 [Desulfosporosinus acididurans]
MVSETVGVIDTQKEWQSKRDDLDIQLCDLIMEYKKDLQTENNCSTIR